MNKEMNLSEMLFNRDERLLDYITNLQEENNNLKEDFKRHIDRINELTERSDNLQEERNNMACLVNELQEENKRLKENAIHNDKVVDKAKWNEMIYKSRCEKAIEYINNLSNEPNIFGHYGIEGNCKKYLLNILQGSDKDDK